MFMCCLFLVEQWKHINIIPGNLKKLPGQSWDNPVKIMFVFYNVQMDAAVLADRLPEGTQKSAQPPLCSAGIERARKRLQS